MSDEETTQPEPFKRRVIARFERKFDVEVHVSEIEIDGTQYVDVREYIPSLGQYGRGILVPHALGLHVNEAVAKAFSGAEVGSG